ncbi:glycoside hydrolase family 3 C-terminal domain-containing protein [Paenibacillus thiaminolyticus]|uniref:Glycoside hydrolase family 3 C-terminal domain-containing protein n=1 Tax=Paenibacillus thiaminolyticus TaxID=49283 RepID=A0AAP9DXS4_PANTH|nr:glycoside hydrolase family 3 C-terminal domain-containing protein [Paenibacillus thiaminolyticus]MCY9537753.1 glycoside hydrolase family 3 C-terminal domain-containing protein [Paenibacillus thiaminolyticus]MCY9600310.1 glycoside hydrolase family 3 C-terminal domain-containing protein [Paenibacillus thiaminolyticus]MCY9607360.1 glycoside hydrolase family 3 C-terminal domain-containing protein [Paenibacillus thiaminolyticus]MCY9613897.1 glycoside hydrolase family 3 C-terminal domain-containin
MKTVTESDMILTQLTLEEKASLCAGLNMWMTKSVDRLNIPAIAMYDGTNGIRKTASMEELGIFGDNVPATCYPTGSAIGSSWNVELLRELGVALGKEGRELDVEILLGPGINMKRTPLGGRNFEYYSEDPCLTGELGAAFVDGLQSQGVAASVKHFACNNQEYEKMITSSEVDERTLREIYLSAFERIVKKANPWTIMCSYNLLNGEYTSENEFLLKKILREEWGYDGVVLSDWTAVDNRVKGIKAGLDLEMPGPAHYNTKAIVEAVQSGELEERQLDTCVRRILELVRRTREHRGVELPSAEERHKLARRAAAESMVLLKNDKGLLPLQPERLSSVAVIGRFAKQPRIQGAGSAKVTPTQVDIPWDEMQDIAGERLELRYAEGYAQDSPPDTIDECLIEESVALARRSDVAIIFAGQPESSESEGLDIASIDLPCHQSKLIQAVADAQPNCIVVLSSGTALVMRPWIDQVSCVIQGWLSGQGGGRAIAEILFGLVNPSGKLSETFPVKLSDTPSYLYPRGENGKLFYREGLFTGYRYYDRKQLEPQFPFGHGLSYTTFEYVSLEAVQTGDEVHVTCAIRNTGTRSGKEIIQLYVNDEECLWQRPDKELKAFAKVNLEPGETKMVHFTLDRRDFSYYNTKQQRWVADMGFFNILAGSSSRDIRLRCRLHCDFGTQQAVQFHTFSLLSDWLRYSHSRAVLEEYLADMNRHAEEAVILNEEFIGFWNDFPLIKIIQMFGQQWLQDTSPHLVIEEMLERVARCQPADEELPER